MRPNYLLTKQQKTILLKKQRNQQVTQSNPQKLTQLPHHRQLPQQKKLNQRRKLSQFCKIVLFTLNFLKEIFCF